LLDPEIDLLVSQEWSSRLAWPWVSGLLSRSASRLEVRSL
jgi:hypothetical protein